MNCKYCQNESCVMAGIPNEVPSKCPDAVATNADRIRAMTDEATAAVAQYLLQENKSMYFEYKGKKHKLCVVEVDNGL